jgi:hypothetical protein
MVSQKSNGSFWLVIVIVPILVSTGAELILRSVDCDGNLELVVEKTVLGTERAEISRKQERNVCLHCKSTQRMKTQERCSPKSHNNNG